MTRALSVLEFDLTDEYASKKIISPEIVKLLGEGRGTGLWWMFQQSFGDPSSLTVQEPLVIVTSATGMAWGIARSPMNHLVDVGQISGSLGSSLKNQGIFLLSISRKAREISILLIENDEPKLYSMPEIQGKTIEETESALKEKFGLCSRLVTGSAADNGVRFASAFHKGHIVGKMGFGQAMASKSLKAIVVKKNPQEKEKKEEKETSNIEKFCKEQLNTIIATQGYLKFFHHSSSAIGSLFDLGRDISATYPSIHAQLDWFLGSLSLGPLLDVIDVIAIKKALRQCWNAGLDPIAVGSIIASIARLNQIKKGSPHPKIKFGTDYGLKFIPMIESNSKFGKELAIGPEHIMTLRAESPLTLRGVPIPPIHFNRSPFLALSLASGPMMSSPAIFATLMLESKIFQNKWDHWNKAAPSLSWWHKVSIGFECFGIGALEILPIIQSNITSGWKAGAKLLFSQMLKYLFPEKVLPIPREEILKIGERTILLERLFNSKQGFDSKDERLPKIFFSKENEGIIERKRFFDTRTKYYEAFEINRVGMPSLKSLKRLKLDKILRF
ncbi:MAG: aldehyde ferredoxin oxidoreductase N-terminal domain-containing protein [Candidatus Hodarchaeota archaeon]